MSSLALPTVELFVTNILQTRAIAQKLSKMVALGDCLTLVGNLGSGKTLFARAFIQSLTSVNVEVLSPTFTLVETYETAVGEIYHFDFYRISYPEEVFELGFFEALSKGILLIEWPCRLGNFLPANRLEIEINHEGNGDSRRIKLAQYGDLKSSDWDFQNLEI